MQSILISPAFPSNKLREGTHLSENDKVLRINSKNWKIIQQNNNPRYHFLKESLLIDQYKNEKIITSLALDFKSYFTISRDFLYSQFKEHYIASLNELFRESLSARFSHFLSRIGLPEL